MSYLSLAKTIKAVCVVSVVLAAPSYATVQCSVTDGTCPKANNAPDPAVSGHPTIKMKHQQKQ